MEVKSQDSEIKQRSIWNGAQDHAITFMYVLGLDLFILFYVSECLPECTNVNLMLAWGGQRRMSDPLAQEFLMVIATM